jgi:GR25 family glycosyltransferase involved in LPS biosynthesis
MNIIDKIYYINLERRPDRNIHFLNEYEKHNLPKDKLIRFDAIDGIKYNFSNEEYNMFENVDYKGRHFEKNIMGNQLSHYYILKEMIEKKYNYIIIFQDDVIFKKNFFNYIDNLMESIPEDSEIINIGLHKDCNYYHFVPWDLNNEYNDDYEKIGKIKINNHICILHDFITPCSLGYIVTLKGAINITSFFKEYGFLKATDYNYNEYLINKNIFYGSTNILCTGNPSLGSDIFI